MTKIMQRMLSGLMCLALFTGSLPVIAEEALPTPAAEITLPEEVTQEPAQELSSAEPTEAAAAEPTEEPVDVPEEVPAEPTPVPEDVPVIEADAEITAVPEITEEPAVIDYTADAGKSPAFVIGYAQAPAYAIPVYESADASAAVKAELGENSVVYAVERVASPDRLRVFFNANPMTGLDSG